MERTIVPRPIIFPLLASASSQNEISANSVQLKCPLSKRPWRLDSGDIFDLLYFSRDQIGWDRIEYSGEHWKYWENLVSLGGNLEEIAIHPEH